VDLSYRWSIKEIDPFGIPEPYRLLCCIMCIFMFQYYMKSAVHYLAAKSFPIASISLEINIIEQWLDTYVAVVAW
jgi:hypothetical protein